MGRKPFFFFKYKKFQWDLLAQEPWKVKNPGRGRCSYKRNHPELGWGLKYEGNEWGRRILLGARHRGPRHQGRLSIIPHNLCFRAFVGLVAQDKLVSIPFKGYPR